MSIRRILSRSVPLFGIALILFTVLISALPTPPAASADVATSRMNVSKGTVNTDTSSFEPAIPMTSRTVYCRAVLHATGSIKDYIQNNNVPHATQDGITNYTDDKSIFGILGSSDELRRPANDSKAKAPLYVNDAPSGNAADAYKEARDTNNTPPFITFDGDGGNSLVCKAAGLLVQSPQDHSKFYGAMYASSDINRTYFVTFSDNAGYTDGEARVDAKNGTVTFYDPIGDWQRFRDYTTDKDLKPPAAQKVVLNLSNYDPSSQGGVFGGGGSGGGAVCPTSQKLSDVSAGGADQLQACLNAMQDSAIKFTQENTISLEIVRGGKPAIFTSQKWGGNSSDHFVLTDPGADTDLNLGKCTDKKDKSYIRVPWDLGNSGVGRLDLDTLGNFKKSMETLGASGQFIAGANVSNLDFHLTNCHITDAHANIPLVETGGTINIVGNFNGGDGTITTVYDSKSAEDHERDVAGVYGPASGGGLKYLRNYDASGKHGCQDLTNSAPSFQLDSDPTKAKQGDLISGIWSMKISASDGCNAGSFTEVPIQIRVGSATATAGGASTDDTPATTLNVGCDFQFTNPLTWVICPVVELLKGFASVADKIVTSQLYTDPNNIFCSKQNTCQAYYTAWQEFRNIALGLMVIGGLLMLIAQALGYELLDAYTVRKVLPRLLIAAVGITVSWPLMKFFVIMTDDLGYGIRSLIYAPFNHLQNSYSINFGTFGIDTIFGSVGVLGAFAAWIAFGGPLALMTYVGTAALAVLIAVVVLVLRQVAITLLIIVAPIAIVAYILPNTQKMYKFWWDSFSKALLMFPIIAGFIATGRVFSAIANTQSQQHTIAGGNVPDAISLLYGTIGLLAYFAPYFMIPFTFKLAGGAVANLAGIVNDRSKGAFDRMKKARQDSTAKRRKMARGRGLYRDVINAPALRNKDGRKLRSIRSLREARDYASGLSLKDSDGLYNRKNIAGSLNRTGTRFLDTSDYLKQKIGGNTWKNDRQFDKDGNEIPVGKVKQGIGRIGGFMFGRDAATLKEHRADARIEHSAELANHLGIRYHGARAVQGAGGLSHAEAAVRAAGAAGATVATGRYKGMNVAEAFDLATQKTDENGQQQYYDDDKPGQYTTVGVDPTTGQARAKVYKDQQGKESKEELASIFEATGDSKLVEGAKDLKKAALMIDNAPKDEKTHRADGAFSAAMISANAGRMEGPEIVRYFTDCLEQGMDHEEAAMRTKKLQELAAKQRPSLRDGYGLTWTTNDHGHQVPKYAYSDPTSQAAQDSVGSWTSDMIRGIKGEEFLDGENLTLPAQAWIARMSDHETKWVKNKDGKMEIVKGVEKSVVEKEKAEAARKIFVSNDWYAAGDAGLVAGVRLILRGADVPTTTLEEQRRAAAPGQRPDDPSGGNTYGGTTLFSGS